MNSAKTITCAASGAMTRRAMIAGAAAIGTVSSFAAVQAATAAQSSMANLISQHRILYARWRAADDLYEEADAAIRQGFDEADLILPARGTTFCELRLYGAEHCIARRSDPATSGSLGPLKLNEAARLRRFEEQIRAIEAEHSWSGLTAMHNACDLEEGHAWDAILKARPATLAEAAERMRYILERRSDECLCEEEVAMLAGSYLDA